MEKDFESRKNEYLDRLRNNFELFEMMKFNEKEKGDVLKVKEMILDPKNEDELAFAVLTLDFADLVVRAANGYVKTILPEDNKYLSLLIEVMNSLKSDKNVEHMVEEAKKNSAEYLYDYVVGFVDDTDTTVDYVAKETGYNLYDDLELAQFQLYLEKANSIININNSEVQPGMTSNDGLRNMSDEFHRICEEGRFESIARRKNI